MCKVFVARQPIFDKNKQLYGYELLYQYGYNNHWEDTNEDQATAALLDKLLYSEFDYLIDGTQGYIRFSDQLIIKKIPLMLPKSKLVVEIPGDIDITDELADACRNLKNQGYTLALQHFNLRKARHYDPIIEYIDIIKVDYSRTPIEEQTLLIRFYRKRVMLIAERVETTVDYQNAVLLGYHLFQGFFYSEPVTMLDQDIGSLANNLMLMVSELGKPEPDYKAITEIIESDVDLSYKLLRMANSAFFASKIGITSIRKALVHIGTEKLFRWSHLMLIKGVQNAENEELVKASLIRGKLLSLLAQKLRRRRDESDYFIAGIFSSIDALLGEEMSKIVERLPLANQVKNALLGNDNPLRNWLDAIIDFEKTKWDQLEKMLEINGITNDEFMSLYLEALKWCIETNEAANEAAKNAKGE